ncbi:potassium channel family protein [Vibrio ostreicida]|uniref:Potassium channel family protein n=1 Tax=Vibrio ostreicida TaxID=526588 RepID=A0ABT8BX37_9VIBR|nr:potassium channel family protein [Vibrio ostreicida]MDN3610939.1 potassium channel family protein [Vibrio ostreicida]NPD10518.1 potassium channel family protein [Vibrio ostreicida]
MKKSDIRDDIKPMSVLSLILSFMALFVISGLLFFPLRAEIRQILIGLDFVICSIFLIQLSIDFFRSNDRRLFLKQHWLDIVASIPMIEPLRYARIFHILRIILVMRTSRSVIKQLLKNKHETTIASILLMMVILLTLGSSLMLFIEGHSPEANIQSGGDAMWWALVTISTVGYGDHYPVTEGGKILAAGLIIGGVGLFGMISGLITSMITAPSQSQTYRSENKERLLIEIVAKQELILKRLDQIEQHQKREHKAP